MRKELSLFGGPSSREALNFCNSRRLCVPAGLPIYEMHCTRKWCCGRGQRTLPLVAPAQTGIPPASLIAVAALTFLFFTLTANTQALAQSAAPTAPQKARILLVTGIDYPGHLWKQTAPVLAAALRQDPRLEVVTIEDPHFLDSDRVQNYDLVLLHFENWDEKGPSEKAQQNLRRFVENGKGLALVHFACGAWHDEWLEFAQIAGRVWFGQNPGPGKRQHDPYGPFRVELLKSESAIGEGLGDFETQDELYTCLTGDHPIEIIAQAKSKVDGQYYPLAFTSRYGNGKTFHCVLGHDAKALSVPGVQELYRRGCAWAAGLQPKVSQSK